METVEPNAELLQDVYQRLQRVWEGDRELDCRVCYALGMNWINPNLKDESTTSWRDHIERYGYRFAWVSDHVYGRDSIPNITSDISTVYRMIDWLLPHHDYISISRDPSGVGAEVGNWWLSHPDGPTIGEYAQSVHGTEALALLGAFIKALNRKLTDTSVTRPDKRIYEE